MPIFSMVEPARLSQLNDVQVYFNQKEVPISLTGGAGDAPAASFSPPRDCLIVQLAEWFCMRGWPEVDIGCQWKRNQ